KELLAKAGFPNGQGLPEIKMSFGSTPRNKIRAEFLAGQFQKNLGVNVVLDAVEPTTYTAMQKDAKTYPQLGFNIGWCSDYPDPQNWLTTYWRSTAFAKRYGYNNPDLDKLMDAADVEQDSAKRLQMYQQAEKTILDTDVAYIPLWLTENVFMVKPYVQTGKTTSHDIDFPGWFEATKLGIKR
ncbi:MAG: peptide ABC transporter substrate-binding protein, partial [Anaerolineae bacterium]|nr:peptide ABC transporter substrate-binding protein [Anaerolineae bacterium]